MRYRKPFTVYPRKLRSGKIIFYYQTYDNDGIRTVAKSTGQTSKSAAEFYCFKLYKENKLIPDKEILFSDYARDWWVYDKCTYIKGKLERDYTISRSNADTNRTILEKHILPCFKGIKLNKITTEKIEKWVFSLKDKNLSNKSVNNYLGILRIMINEAYRLGLITKNPVKAVKPLKAIKNRKTILSKNEFKRLCDPQQIKRIWGKPEFYIANLLAAFTGMRLGEIQALRAENVHSGYVHVCFSWDRKYGLKDTKTHDSRDIPIHRVLYKSLSALITQNPGGFLFSDDGGLTPMYYKKITEALYGALAKIKITKEKRKERKLTFHSWRHFFNSTMRGKIEDYKLQRLTGHKTQEMTEHYTQLCKDDLEKMISVQEGFLLTGSSDVGEKSSEEAAHVN